MDVLVWTQLPPGKGSNGEVIEFWSACLPGGQCSVASVQGPTRYNSRYRLMVTVRWKDADTRDCSSLADALRDAEGLVADQLRNLGVVPR